MKRVFFLMLWLTAPLQGVVLQAQQLRLQINTIQGSLMVNNQVITRPFRISQIAKLLGKPDRIEVHQRKARYERFAYKNNPPSSTMITVKDKYHIYDRLGLLFITNQSIIKSQAPKLIIYFANPRKFTNTTPLKYTPTQSFQGHLLLNNHQINTTQTVIPSDVTYHTDQFYLWNIPFGPTSIGGVIDRLYSIKTTPYLMIYLDNAENQRVSYIVIK